MHVNVIQALRNVGDPRFLVLGRWCHEMDAMRGAGTPFGLDYDFKVTISRYHGIDDTQGAATCCPGAHGTVFFVVVRLTGVLNERSFG